VTIHVGHRLARWRPLCGQHVADDDRVISLAQALSADGDHFDCVECHKALTRSQRHSGPKEDR